jgi:hypothetical protein
VANRDLWERLLEGTRRHREVRWRKVKGHSKTGGAHKSGNDRADELAVTAKKEASGERTSGPRPATSAFLTEEAERSVASLLGDWGDFSSLVRGVSGDLSPESHFPPAKPADRVDHCLGIVDLPLT